MPKYKIVYTQHQVRRIEIEVEVAFDPDHEKFKALDEGRKLLYVKGSEAEEWSDWQQEGTKVYDIVKVSV